MSFNRRSMSTAIADTEPGRRVEIAGEGAFPVALEGLPYILGAFILALATGVLVHWTLALPFLAFALFASWFFRNPTRTTPLDPDAVISPADGTICQIAEVEESEHLKSKATRVSIFMSVVNVHINRAPLAGRVLATRHTPGRFAVASLDKASTENERNAILMEAPGGRKVLFTQIAGSIARRIVCYAAPGDSLAAGQRFGLIRFGSRVDVFLPAGSRCLVSVGQKVVGGETLLGRFQGSEP